MPQAHATKLAVAPLGHPAIQDATTLFERQLSEARRRADAKQPEEALELCWSARRLAKREALERVGEADLAIGVMLLDLDRMNEGLEAVYRAVRYFASRGELFLRGCAEALLAEAALRRREPALAARHLSVAGDLLVTGGGATGAVAALAWHAGRLERDGRDDDARVVRRLARRIGVRAVPG